MKKIFLTCFTCCLILSTFIATADKPHTKEKVRVGIYINSIHDIDFKQKEYTIDFWLWLKYRNKDFDFEQNLEIPLAKTITKSFSSIDSSDGKVFLVMKLQCVMQDSWKIANFPFDKQKLRLSIENSQYDMDSLEFVPDTSGKSYDPRFTLNGWKIDSCLIKTGIKSYETTFGDTSAAPHSEYSSYKVTLNIERDAAGLFWKLFLGMYIAFLIAYMSFFIHTDGMDSRFGLNVGALFAVIGNKYVVDSSLPESTSFTLADTLHGLTLLFVLTVIISTAYSFKLVKSDKIEKAARFDKIARRVLLVLYAGLNVWFIYKASKG